jgi:hypothetical protein
LGSRKLTWKALLTTTTTYTYTLGVWLVLGVLGWGLGAEGIRNPESFSIIPLIPCLISPQFG